MVSLIGCKVRTELAFVELPHGFSLSAARDERQHSHSADQILPSRQEVDET
jgi:hypothetical protein